MTMRNDHGFTLVEALMALLIISLSLAGVFEASRFVSHMNRRVLSVRKIAQTDATFQAELRAKLIPLQPIEGGELSGDVHKVHFACDSGTTAQNCSIDAGDNRQFAYVGNGQTANQWPPATVEDAIPPRLEAVLIRDGRGNNIATITLPVEHNRNCQFDMISRTCRVQADSSADSPQAASE